MSQKTFFLTKRVRKNFYLFRTHPDDYQTVKPVLTFLTLKSFSDMDSNDFNKLIGLLTKFTAATEKANREDGTFRKYHERSISELRNFPNHLKRIEQGLRTAKIIKQ